MQISRQIRVVCAVAIAFLIGPCAPALAADAVSVSKPWVRATVAGQSVAGAYMDITAKANAALVAVASPAAAKAELHTMTMDGGVMKMRPLAKLELPAGKTVNLKPGARLLRAERHYGRVYRAFALDQDVDETATQARYTDGILELTLPKKASAAVKRIAIQ